MRSIGALGLLLLPLRELPDGFVWCPLLAYVVEPPAIGLCLAPRIDVGIIRSRLNSLGLTYLLELSPGMPPGKVESLPLCFFPILAEPWLICCSRPAVGELPGDPPPPMLLSFECRALLPCGVADGNCGLPDLFVTEYEPLGPTPPSIPSFASAYGVALAP